MHIVSKFRDYYDGINPSKTPFWKRLSRYIELDRTKKSELSIHQRDFCNNALLQIVCPKVDNPLVDDYYTFKLLGLCGKLYPIYDMRYKDYYKPYLDIDKFIKEYNNLSPSKRNQPKNYFLYHGKYAYYNHTFTDRLSPTQWQTEFQKKNYLDQLFIDLNTPVFILYRKHFRSRRITLEVNPCLSNHGIQRLFDVYSLYQMIEQYLSNELVMNTDKPAVMSDVIKRDKHGFYDMSFKNRGGKNKGKNK